MKTLKLLTSLIITTLVFTSCARYSCKAPDGITCKSVSEVYAKHTQARNQQEEVIAITKKDRESQPHEDKTPLWIPAKKLRLWISRWVDSKGNYHQPGHLYIEVEKGRWATDQAEIDEMIIEEKEEENGDTD